MSKNNFTISSNEIKAYIKVCTAIRKNATEIYETLKQEALGTSISRATVFRWVRHFESGNSGTVTFDFSPYSKKNLLDAIFKRDKPVVLLYFSVLRVFPKKTS